MVATRLPALAGVAEIDMVTTGAEMANALEAQMAADTPDAGARDPRLPSPSSWESRIGEIEAALAR